MSALGQRHFHPTLQKAKVQKYFDEELRATSAQRNSFSLSKTSLSPERGRRNRGLSASHHLGLDRKQIDGLRGQRNTTRDMPVRCRTAEKRIRSGRKNGECTALEVNAGEPRNPSEKLRDMPSSGATQE